MYKDGIETSYKLGYENVVVGAVTYFHVHKLYVRRENTKEKLLITPSVTNCKGFSPHLSIHVHMYVDECINIKYIHGIGHESSSYVCQ